MQYVTYTAPNHMSIMTGLREDSHGIVSNYFYDPATKEQCVRLAMFSEIILSSFDLFNMTYAPGAVNKSLVPHW